MLRLLKVYARVEGAWWRRWLREQQLEERMSELLAQRRGERALADQVESSAKHAAKLKDGTELCRFFSKGACNKGDQCTFKKQLLDLWEYHQLLERSHSSRMH